MPYGILKVDQVTFTNAGVDQTISVSGIVASISGNITATGTISGDVIRGGTLVSGATVTGTAGQFGTITGNTAGFTTVTGTTVTGTTANFVTVSGTTVTGNVGNFTTGLTRAGNNVVTVGDTGTVTSAMIADGQITSAKIADATIVNQDVSLTAAIDGTKISPNFGSQNVVTTGTVTGASLSPTSSSVPTNGVYLPAANSVAVATNGTARLYIASDGKVGVGTTSPSTRLTSVYGEIAAIDTSDPNTTTALTIAGSNATSISGNFGTLLQIRGIENRGGVVALGAVATSSNKDGGHSLCFYRNSGNGTIAEAARITSAGNVGIGTTTPNCALHVRSTDSDTSQTLVQLQQFNAAQTDNASLIIKLDPASNFVSYDSTGAAAGQHVFLTGSTESARIDSSGRLLVGTSSSFDTNSKFQVESDTDDKIALKATSAVANNGSAIKFIVGSTPKASINGGNDASSSAVLKFSTTADGASSPTERMRIKANADICFNTTDASPAESNVEGVTFQGTGSFGTSSHSRSGFAALLVNRKTNDGDLIRFYQDGTQEGSISVSGTTVTLNGAHLSRWSQIPGIDPHDKAVRPEILRGTVMSNLDEMCDWIDPDSGDAQANEQLNKTKISDVEGDKNVAGVFQSWDDDDDTWVNDYYLAMTGDFVIRIAAGVTVERGDLLMSAGDGTAKPQTDDALRSCTIAKVTSTHVSRTFDDGSYCVPCVLMAC